MRYESDYEWAAIKQFLPNKPRGVPRVNDRRVVARPSINNTVDGPIGFSRRSRLHAARRASDREIASRHLPHGSGDVGLHEGAGPVHEVQEGLVIHPRGHRAAAAAGGGAALGMERGPTAKAVTEPAAWRADRRPGQPSSVADVGPRRPTSSARPFDGTTGGMGDTRDATKTCWWVQRARDRLALPPCARPPWRSNSDRYFCCFGRRVHMPRPRTCKLGAPQAAAAFGSIAARFFCLTLFMARSIGRTVNSLRSSRKSPPSGDSFARSSHTSTLSSASESGIRS
jgi:hypothetical protein